MRVICIDNKGCETLLKESKEYSVAQCPHAIDMYTVDGLEKFEGGDAGYYKYRFIVLSNKSETEMERNYQLKQQTV